MALSRQHCVIEEELVADHAGDQPRTLLPVRYVRGLPDGKKYHLLFCYNINDKDYVVQMVNTLERPPYQLKCCIDCRDFQLGQTFIDNISTCMQQSLKVVLILSPSFLESHYCKFEQNLAQYKSLNDRTSFVIPLILKPCNLPDSIKVYNYIAEKDGEVDGKIVRALYDDPFFFLNKGLFPQGEASKNGSSVQIPAVQTHKHSRWALSMFIPDITDENFQKIQEHGCKIQRRSLQRTIQKINADWKFRYRGLRPWASCHGCCLYLLGMTLASIITAVICEAYDVDDRIYAINLLKVFGVYTALIVILCFIIWAKPYDWQDTWTTQQEILV